MKIWDVVAISDYINVPEVMPDLRVTKYTPKAAGPGWYTP